MSNNGRALVITKNDFRQERDGGSKRTAGVVRALRESGFEVDFVAVSPFHTSRRLNSPQRISSFGWAVIVALLATLRTFSASCLKWFSPRAAAYISALCRERSYSLAVVEHSQLVAYAAVTKAQIYCMNMQNIESELMANYANSRPGIHRMIAARFESARLRAVESRFTQQFDIVATVSEHDARTLMSYSPSTRSRVVVASNGVGDEFFSIRGSRDAGVVFIAHLGWRPNVDAAVWLVDQVWPKIRDHGSPLDLRLVGRSPAAGVQRLATVDIEVHGDVPSVAPYLASAKVATAPLHTAGGTRIKILEALASGTPVVSTSLGALGLESLVGEFLVIADAPSEFAAAVVDLASRDIDRDRVRALVDGYRWHASLAPLLEAVHAYSEPRSSS